MFQQAFSPMKTRSQVALGFFALITSIALYACTDAAQPDRPNLSEPSTLSEPQPLFDGIVLPVGTELRDGVYDNGKPFIRFQLPEGYKLVGKIGDGDVGYEARLETGGDITCECTSGDGECLPFHAEGSGEEAVGCIHRGCTTCLGTVSGNLQSDEGTRGPIFSDAVVLSMNENVGLVNGIDELNSLACFKPWVLEVEPIREEVNQFISEMRGSDAHEVASAANRDELPDEYRMLPVNVFGTLVITPVSKELSSFEMLLGGETFQPAKEAIEGGRGSCSCSDEDGNGECKHVKESIPILGSVEYCDPSGCDACTLTY